MTQVMATLKVVLQANDTIVAEAEDPVLWQKVLTVINAGGKATEAGLTLDGAKQDVEALSGIQEEKASSPGHDAVGRLAQQLSVTREALEGACSPSSESPFMHLDAHCWEEMKRQIPPRGAGAISPIGLAGTLIGLWFRTTGSGNPTQAQAQAVLRTVGIQDKNATRGIQSSTWLQARPGGAIQINPAQISTAVLIARSFCSQDWSEYVKA